MKGPGILWMLQTAVGLSMAGPMFVVGLEFLREGQVVGGVGFFALGLVALFAPSYLVKRIGGPRAWIRRRKEGIEKPSIPNPLDRFREGGDE